MIQTYEEAQYNLHRARLRKCGVGKTRVHGMELETFVDEAGLKHVVEISHYQLYDRAGLPRYVRRISETVDRPEAGSFSVTVRTYEYSRYARPEEPGVLVREERMDFHPRRIDFHPRQQGNWVVAPTPQIQ